MTKILLVEDDKSLREIYGVRLLAEGYDIVSAGDGEEALAMAIKERPQLIVSDVMMPKISGFDMLDILRSTTETKNIKVIMMTALSSEDQRARGEALGADRYLVKSQVGIEDVVRTVHEVLGDAPVSAPSAAQTFSTPPPSAVPRSAPAMPQRPPAQPYPPTPAASPTPQTTTPTQAAPSGSGLPQPTAPFSTPRPANLGDRIIHPVNPQGDNRPTDLGSLIDQELGRADAEAQQPQATAPAQAAPPAPPTPAAPRPPEASTPTVPPREPAPLASAQPGELHGASNVTFEETPRQAAPASQQPQAPQPSNPFSPPQQQQPPQL